MEYIFYMVGFIVTFIQNKKRLPGLTGVFSVGYDNSNGAKPCTSVKCMI